MNEVEWFRRFPTGGTVFQRPESEGSDMAQEEGRSAPDLLAQDSEVKWEKQFDNTVRTVKFELANVPHMMKRSRWSEDQKRFLPQWVEVVFDSGARRWVTVRGASIRKDGTAGARAIESYYSGTRDDEHMPEWLKQLVAEVSS